MVARCLREPSVDPCPTAGCGCCSLWACEGEDQVPGRTERLRSIELLLLVAMTACQQTPRAEKSARPRATSSGVIPVSLAPRPASSFSCGSDGCIQLHPRLPDSGEWRCAERGQVVWCAGGEPAAGVVSGPPDPRYRCGRRWGQAREERVCVDRSPDY